MPTGIYKRTLKTRKKMSLSKKGKNNPNFGKKHSLKQRKKFGSKGKMHPNWKGGRKYHNGYVYIFNPSHPHSTVKGYIYEHRLIMELFLGRYLTKNEIVHHKNKIKDDNRIINLKLFKNNAEHTSYHHKLK